MKTIERLIADLTPYHAIQEIPASVLNEAIMTMQALLDYYHAVEEHFGYFDDADAVVELARRRIKEVCPDE